MNKILLEVLRSNFYMHEQSLDAMTPLLLKLIAGDKIHMTLSPIGISSYLLATKSVVANVWENPLLAVASITEDCILNINIDSAITKYDNCGWYGAQSYAKLINAAAQNTAIKSILLIADSPGGSADGSFDLAYAVKQAAAIKPVVTYVDGMAASAMYRVAAHCTHIVAKPGSFIGSIGTMTRMYDSSKARELAGIVVRDVYATKSPDKNKDTDEALAGRPSLYITSILDPLNDIFLKEMKAERNLADEVMTGKIYFPEQAIENGMIDSIGVFEDALQVCNDLIQTQKINPPKINTQMALKIPTLIASILGLSAQSESLSQEQVDQLNSRLEGMTALESQVADLQNQISTKETAISQLAGEKTSLESVVSTHVEAIQTLTTERDALQSKVDEYGAQPGTTPSVAQVDPNAVVLNLDELDDEAKAIVQKYL